MSVVSDGGADLRNALYQRGDWCGECDPAEDQGCCVLPSEVRAALRGDA